ncbi:hypothetical protein Hanom_Chr06g00495021 [Helianthus anomalus]
MDYQFSCSTMWMFVLVLMVLTRTRSEDDSRVLTTHSTAEGSASTRILRPNRRRKLNSTNTRATGIFNSLKLDVTL